MGLQSHFIPNLLTVVTELSAIKNPYVNTDEESSDPNKASLPLL